MECLDTGAGNRGEMDHHKRIMALRGTPFGSRKGTGHFLFLRKLRSPGIWRADCTRLATRHLGAVKLDHHESTIPSSPDKLASYSQPFSLSLSLPLQAPVLS